MLLSVRRAPWARLCLTLCAALCLSAAAFAQVNVNGVDYEGMVSLAKKNGMSATWVIPGKTARLKKSGVEIVLTVNDRYVTINGNPLALGAPIVQAKGQLQVSSRDIVKTLRPLLVPGEYAPAPALKRIVIDAGHGGKDPGALNKAYGLMEKSLTLDVAKRLKPLLEAKGYQVFMTRTTDTSLGRTERTAIVNRLGADLFISIHFNTVGDTSVTGIEAWAMTPLLQASTGRSTFHPSDRVPRENNRYDAWNVLAAYYICDALSDQMNTPSRGVKRARFDMMTGVKAPAVLVECGFMSNPEHARAMRTPEYRQKLAQGVAEGVSRYQRRINTVPTQ